MPISDSSSSRPKLVGPKVVAALLGLATVFGITSPAYAEALVVVEVRTPSGDPANGTVTLKAQSGDATYTCTTENGTCRIDDVPGGQYTATLVPDDGVAPEPRNVMIPPAGRVTLRVSTR